MERSDDESCCTDYDTDGFWSSEKTLLESVRDGGGGSGGNGCRRRTKKRKKTASKDSTAAAGKDSVAAAGKPSAVAEATVGLRLRWQDFLREHDDEWRGFRTIGRKCFVDVVRPTGCAMRGCSSRWYTTSGYRYGVRFIVISGIEHNRCSRYAFGLKI